MSEPSPRGAPSRQQLADNLGENPMVWVLLKETENRNGSETHTTVMGVYEAHVDLVARVARIDKANPQYEMRRLNEVTWRIGPDEDEDEGFFGNRPVYLQAVHVSFHPDAGGPVRPGGR